jgi:hypothetical protein
LEADYAAEGKVDLFRELRLFNSAQQSAPSYTEAALKLGLPENTVAAHDLAWEQYPDNVRKGVSRALGINSPHSLADPLAR